MHEFMREFVDEFFGNFVHEFKYEIRTNSHEFVWIFCTKNWLCYVWPVLYNQIRARVECSPNQSFLSNRPFHPVIDKTLRIPE